ncbi:MAG: branched-chain amino acid ABC transporter permease [Solirubrobacterales bacterium]
MSVLWKGAGAAENLSGAAGGAKRNSPALGVAVLVVALGLVPLLSLSEYTIGVLTLIFIYASVNLSWNYVLGHAGILSFASLAFFAIGGYTAGILNTEAGISPWLAFLAGGAAGGLAGLAVGIPSLRLYGPYMVLFTLCFHMMIQVVISTDTSGFTGGALGLTGIESLGLPGVGDKVDAGYYLGLLLVAATYLAIRKVLNGPIGLALRSLRDDEAAAVARGVSRTAHRQIVFVSSSVLLGLAGAFYACYYGYISPVVLSLALVMNLFAMVVVGGLGSRLGPVLGTALLVLVNEQLQSAELWRPFIWGAIVVVTLLLVPRGIAPAAGEAWRRLRRMFDEWMEEEVEVSSDT